MTSPRHERVRSGPARAVGVAAIGLVATLLAAGTVLGVDPSPTGPSPEASTSASASVDPSGASTASASAGAETQRPEPSPAASPTPAAAPTPAERVAPTASEQPEQSPKPPKPPKAPKADKAKTPEAPIIITGTVTATTDAEGRTTYTMSANGTTYELDLGPHWWWGDDHPLQAHVGTRVTIAGGIAAGSNEVDVDTIDGATVRTWTGKPPWAGGPKAVGERHPGWTSWHAAHPDGKPGKGHGVGRGRDGAPGQLKKASPTPTP